MLGELTPPDKEKYQIYCPHCGNAILSDDLCKTDDNKQGCINCIYQCRECGELCFDNELDSNQICNNCYESNYHE